MVKVFKDAGVEIKDMSQADFNAWLDIAKASSYKIFSEKVEGGDALIKKALAVQ